MKKMFLGFILLMMTLFVGVKAEALSTEPPATPVPQLYMFRLYNPNSGEHFYTDKLAEANHLADVGWSYEGIGWLAPAQSNTPVYRLYNPNAGDHHYTTSKYENDSLVNKGWRAEGIGWYSSDTTTYPVYRQYNPFAISGAHNFTLDVNEQANLVGLGWKKEGIAWYAASPSIPNPTITVEDFKTGVPISSFSMKLDAGGPFLTGIYDGTDFPQILDFTSSDESVVSGKRAGDYEARGSSFVGMGITNPVHFETTSFYPRKVGTCVLTFKAPSGAKTQITVTVTK